jgi:hypothetical protein
MLLGVRDVQESLVEPSASVLADLLALSQALDEPDSDLESLLRDLGASCALAVSSCLGFSITLVVDGAAVSVTLLEQPLSYRYIVTSVTIPLTSLGGLSAGSEITLFAATPGGFVDLAADLSYALELHPRMAQFDRYLMPAAKETSLTGLDNVKARNQAVGILLDQGYDLNEAGAELDRLARQERTTPEVVAVRLINATIRPPNQRPS